MPLHCPSLTKEIVTKLNQEIHKLPVGHPLHKEILDGDVNIFVENGYAVYHSAGGFYFIRIQTSLEQTIRQDIAKPREYLCTAFEVAEDQTIQQKLIDRFQETYGLKYKRMIEHITVSHNGKHLVLAKLPSCVVRQMLSPHGGTMRTLISGPTESLKQIPTLVRLGNIQEEKETSKSLFVTQYEKGMFQAVKEIHYDLLREVLSKPNLGITVPSFMVWDP